MPNLAGVIDKSSDFGVEASSTGRSQKTILEALEIKKNNNFDALRFVAAFLVLASHSYFLTGHSDKEPIFRFIGYDTGGGWGVAIFFVVSGF
jgi:hypothetical protein